MKKIIISSLCLCMTVCAITSYAQIDSARSITGSDMLHKINTDLYPAWLARRDCHALNFTSVAIPAVGIGYGVLALHKSFPEKLNLSTRNEIKEDNPHFHTHLDNYLQLAPAVAVLGLNAAGIHGSHHFLDELCIYGVSTVLMFGPVHAIKHFTQEQRPDQSSYNSFPSGHTATAFAAAEWLREEYWHRSPWIGIAGYATATATGALRVYNNRHWISDVIAGAAIGFLCTRIAYAINPWIEKHILHAKRKQALSYTTRLEGHYVLYPAYLFSQ